MSSFVWLEVGVFACGEYIHTLRLTSELVELRVECANPAPYAMRRRWV